MASMKSRAHSAPELDANEKGLTPSGLQMQKVSEDVRLRLFQKHACCEISNWLRQIVIIPCIQRDTSEELLTYLRAQDK